MRRLILIAVLAVAAVSGTAVPALAQSSLKPPASTDGTQPREKLVIVYGNDACPKSEDKNEIIVCSRRPDEERYRIPPAVRNDIGKPGAGSRNALVGQAPGGAGGSIGSCTNIGPGGGTGCQQQMQDNYRAEKKAARGVPQD